MSQSPLLNRRTIPLPTVEELHQALEYNPDTGVFRWRVARGHKMKVGSEAGTIGPNGYRIIKMGKAFMRAHRVAIAMTQGAWPSLLVDHINRDRLDNRLVNLRVVTDKESCNNRRPPVKRAHTGVRVLKDGYVAIIGITHIGYYRDLQQAIDARNAAALARWGSLTAKRGKGRKTDAA